MDQQILRVYACLSRGRHSKVNGKELECSEDERMEVGTDGDEEPSNANKLIPFPEPGIWSLGLQVK